MIERYLPGIPHEKHFNDEGGSKRVQLPIKL